MADDLYVRPGYTRAAFELELLSLSDWLHRFAHKLTLSTHAAQDLAQATLVHALAKADQYDPSQKLRSWLGTVMHNVLVDIYRKEVRVVTNDSLFFETHLVSHESFEDAVDVRLQFRVVARQVLALPERQRDAIIGQHYLDFTHSELARIFSCPLGTVKGYIREGMRKIRLGLTGPMPEICIPQVPKDSLYYPIAEAVRTIAKEITERP